MSTQLAEAKATIERQKEELIKPLRLEVKVKDVLIGRIREAHDFNFNELKKMNTVLRIPKMCQEFQQAFRKREEK